MYIYIYIHRAKAGGSPEASLNMYIYIYIRLCPVYIIYIEGIWRVLSSFDMFRMPMVTTTKSKTFQPEFQKGQNQKAYLGTSGIHGPILFNCYQWVIIRKFMTI